jgi:hypothetical protein
MQNPVWGMPGQPFFRPEQINGFLDQVSQVPLLPPRPLNSPCGTRLDAQHARTHGSAPMPF